MEQLQHAKGAASTKNTRINSSEERLTWIRGTMNSFRGTWQTQPIFSPTTYTKNIELTKIDSKIFLDFISEILDTFSTINTKECINQAQLMIRTHFSSSLFFCFPSSLFEGRKRSCFFLWKKKSTKGGMNRVQVKKREENGTVEINDSQYLTSAPKPTSLDNFANITRGDKAVVNTYAPGITLANKFLPPSQTQPGGEN